MDKFNIYMLTILALISSASAAWNTAVLAKDSFTASDGYTCGYAECNKPAGGPRLFHIQCKKGDSFYECIYKGQPHDCGWYNNQGHAAKYYEGLADAAAASQQNACNDEVLTNQKKCKNIDFDFQYKADSNGQWCRSEMAYGGGGMNYDDYKKDVVN